MRRERERAWEKLRASACVVKMLRQLLIHCGHRGIDDNSIPSMWLAEVWWERRIHYKSEQSLLLRSVASILTKKKRKKTAPVSRIPFFAKKRRKAFLVFFFFFHFTRRAMSRTSYSPTIPIHEANAIPKWHNLRRETVFVFYVNFFLVMNLWEPFSLIRTRTEVLTRLINVIVICISFRR